MNVIKEIVNGKEVILGQHFLMEVGNVKVDKIIYRPTPELFEKFYNIIKTKPWFDNYDFTLLGSFPNILNGNKKWETWDVDINMSTTSKELNYEEIKNVLNECSKIALVECDFYLEIYFNIDTSTSYLDENGLYKIQGPKSSWGSDISYYLQIHQSIFDEKNWSLEELKKTNYKNYPLLGKYKTNILSHLLYVKRDNVIVTNWHKNNPGVEIIDGLWKRVQQFPSPKHIRRQVNKLFYDPPINIKEFYKHL
jgi:hypothetical protein